MAGRQRGGSTVAVAFAAEALSFLFVGNAMELQVGFILRQMRRCFLWGMEKKKQQSHRANNKQNVEDGGAIFLRHLFRPNQVLVQPTAGAATVLNVPPVTFFVDQLQHDAGFDIGNLGAFRVGFLPHVGARL